jgi:hypothetical protein
MKQLDASIGNGDFSSTLKMTTSLFWAYPFDSAPANSELGYGAIAGIVIGSVFVTLLTFVSFIAVRRRVAISKTLHAAESMESSEIIDSFDSPSEKYERNAYIQQSYEPNPKDMDNINIMIVERLERPGTLTNGCSDESIEQNSMVSRSFSID